MRARRPTPEGFTLLELTISIMLLATMVVIIGGAVRLSYRSINNGERKANDLERLRVSLTVINAQIESWLPLKVDGEGAKRITLRAHPVPSSWLQTTRSGAARRAMC